MQATKNTKDSSPKPKDRIVLMDALRGFALLGVLLANLNSFANPSLSGFNGLLHDIDDVLMNTKFLTLFSILFGAGFYMQWEKYQQTPALFMPYFAKRMFWLFVIGSLHAHLFWFGDILRIYALCGLLLLLFPIHNGTTTLRWAIALAVPLTAIAFIAQQLTPYLTSDYPSGEQMERAFKEGTYWEIVKMNWAIDPIRHFQKDSILTLVSTLGKVLLGVWLAQMDFFSKAANFRAMRRKWLIWGSTIGMGSSLAFLAIHKGLLDLDSPWLLWVPFVVAGGLLLHALMYLSLFSWLFEKQPGKAILWLAAVGRMSLTNYLAQTIFGMLLFYGIGLGLWGKVSYLSMVLIGFALFTLQIVVSRLWLRRFGMGPVEKVWRKLSGLWKVR